MNSSPEMLLLLRAVDLLRTAAWSRAGEAGNWCAFCGGTRGNKHKQECKLKLFMRDVHKAKYGAPAPTGNDEEKGAAK